MNAAETIPRPPPPPEPLSFQQATEAATCLLSLNADGAPVDDAMLLRIERFLRMEARLLDQERFRDWYGLLADDLFYWAPVRENRYRRDKAPELHAGGMAFFDERKPDIDLRIKRLESGMAWSEDPATRHVYAISNVEAFETAAAGEYEVHSVFAQFRHRAAHDAATLFGRRRDIVRDTPKGFLIARRLVLLQDGVLNTKNLSVFF